MHTEGIAFVEGELLQDMKILFVVNHQPPVIDGVGDYTSLLAKQFAEKKIESFIVCKNTGGINAEIKNGQLAPVHVVPLVKKWNVKENLEILKFARREGVDTVFIQYVPYSFSKLGLPFHLLLFPLLARRHKIKTAIFFHEVAIQMKIKPNWFIRGWLQRVLARLFCISVDNLFVSNKYYFNKFIRPAAASIVPIPSNFIADENFSAGKFTPRSAEDTVHLIAFLNRSPEFLFKAVQQLVRNNRAVRLSLIGSPASDHVTAARGYINKYGLEDVVFVHKDSEETKLVQLMATAAIYIQLEKVENNGFGGISAKSGACAFAMSMALPVVTTKGSLTDDSIYKNGFNALFVDYGDAVSLERTLQELIASPENRFVLGNNALKTYQTQFSWQVVSETILKDLTAKSK